MFYEFKIKDNFYHEYLDFFLERFIYTSIEIEEDQEISARKQKKKNLLEAFKKALDLPNHFVDTWDIRDLGDLVNKFEDVPEGFRKIQVSAGEKAKFTPVIPYEIIPRLYSLVDNYKNVWCDLDVFEREAMFHIELMRIHPFEDGNKRTSKIILNRNLIYNDSAPVIINEEDTDKYYTFINNRDYIGFSEFLRKKSEMELTNMVALYKLLNHIPINEPAEDILKKERK